MTANDFMTLCLFGSTGLAVVLLALAMPRHHTRVFGTAGRAGRAGALRLGGWLALAASLLVAMADWSGGIALVAWFALLTAHAFAVSLLIAYRPRAVPVWTGACAVCAAGALLTAILALVK